jgi:hypothetical protein
VPDPTADTCQIAPRPAGPYASRLTDEDREIYESTTDDLDLGYEIRLMRVALVKLSAAERANYRQITAVFNALVRGLSLQATKLADATDAEEEKGQAADQALRKLESGSQ